jgi:hypothetical protein
MWLVLCLFVTVHRNVWAVQISLCTNLQMVERLDQGADLGPNTAPTYPALHALVAKALFRTHVEGKLKVSIKDALGLLVMDVHSCPPQTIICAPLQAEIIQDPAKYVEKDPAMARTLLDQREAVSAA